LINTLGMIGLFRGETSAEMAGFKARVSRA